MPNTIEKIMNGSQGMLTNKLFWFQTGLDSCNTLEISKIVDFWKNDPLFRECLAQQVLQ